MRTIIHSITKATSLGASQFALDIKVGYILSDTTASIGIANFFIQYLRRIKNCTLKARIHSLREEMVKQEHIEAIDALDNFLRVEIDRNTLKKYSGVVLKSYLRLEYCILAMLKSWEQNRVVYFQQLGFNELEPLINSQTFGFFNIKSENDFSKVLKDGWIRLESIFNQKFPDTDSDPTLIVLNDYFFNPSVISHSLDNPFDFDINNSSSGYIHTSIELPNLNVLESVELKALKDNFNEPLKMFKAAIDEWCTACNDGLFSESIELFKQKIIPLSLAANEVINNHSIIKKAADITNTTTHYISFGEMPKSNLMAYYLYYEGMSENLFNELKDKFAKEGLLTRRVPVMIVSKFKIPALPEVTVTDTEEGELILASRKYLPVD